jgi:hypothetical protein
MLEASADSAARAHKGLDAERGAVFCFAGLLLDLDACTLTRESGEAIALTPAR